MRPAASAKRKSSGRFARGWPRRAKKIPVIALVERDGQVRTRRLDSLKLTDIKGPVRENVDPSATVVTDERGPFHWLGKEFADHQVVKHKNREYVRGDACTNTAESFFALIKRAHYGTHHHYSKKHLPRYVTEQGFKWDHRKVTDGER